MDMMIHMKKYSSDFENLYFEHIIKSLPQDFMGKIVDSCRKFFPSDLNLESIKSLLLMSYENQKKVIDNINKTKNGTTGAYHNMKKECFYLEPITLKEIKTEIYNDYAKLYANRVVTKVNKKKMNILLVNESRMYVCPYCNRNFINSRDDRMGSQLDHFYPISEYPFFAVSLYNLIPSCNVCNHIKQEQALSISPFKARTIEDSLTFEFLFTDYNNVRPIFIEGENVKRDVDILRLKEAYEIHAVDIMNMLDREKKYCGSFKKEIMRVLPHITDREIDTIVFGTAIVESDFQNIPLSKMKYDIYTQIKKTRESTYVTRPDS